MTDTASIVRRWLEVSIERIERHVAELTALDAAIGDGDHGINLQRGFALIGERLAADGDAGSVSSGAELLRMAGTTLVSSVGGASGPLYGTFFLELATTLEGADGLEPATFGQALEAAGRALGRRGRSTTGEKTMLDALVPCAEVWTAVASGGGSLVECAEAARRAADGGRATTESLVATKGRASYLGERSRGHVDPGATSATILIEALAEAVAQLEEDGASR